MVVLRSGDWYYRMYQPTGNGPYPIIFLFHGLGGNESSMDFFAKRFSNHAIVISLRGIFQDNLGGYQWLESVPRSQIWIDDFQPAITSFNEFLELNKYGKDSLGGIRLAGFSQGAAFAYSFALYNPSLIKCVAGIAGFLPSGAQAFARNRPLQGKPVMIAHGNRDEIIPVDRAREAKLILEEAGAIIYYCEDDVGHKLGSDCFSGFASFMLR